MHCNGKCYLSKQLKEQQKQEQAPVTKKYNTEIQFFSNLHEYGNGTFKGNFKKKYYTLNDEKLASFAHEFFHPPSA